MARNTSSVQCLGPMEDAFLRMCVQNKDSRKYSKTSFEKNCFSAWASTLNMGLINKVDMVLFVACGIWCLADVSSVSASSEQTGELWANQCLNSW